MMTDFNSLYRQYATGNTSGGLTILVTSLLLPFSLLYQIVVWFRAALYKFGLLPVYVSTVPVISVGNIAAGGTGKTPVVDFLVKYLHGNGRRVGIVSRGYAGDFKGSSALVSDGAKRYLNTTQAGDEPVLLARRNPAVPVAIAPKRRDGIDLLIEKCQIDCVVLDDAFQHRAVARDLDIVLLDSRHPAGNGHLLPAGILREPFSSIRRADLAVLTRCDSLTHESVSLPITSVECNHVLADEIHGLEGGTLTIDQLKGKKIFAFAGIAEPGSFFSGLQASGFDLSGTFSFPDHVVYSDARLATLVAAAGEVELLLTTEKDAVKIDSDRLPIPCYSIGVTPVFKDEAPLMQMIKKILSKEKLND